MIKSIVDANVTESTMLLKKIIENFFEGKNHGSVRGYLVMDEQKGIIQKKDLKQASCVSEKGICLSWHGSVKCEEPNARIRDWVFILIAYKVKNNLVKELKSYPFEKFEISIEFFPEYIYRKNKIIQHRRTGVILPYFKVHLKW